MDRPFVTFCEVVMDLMGQPGLGSRFWGLGLGSRFWGLV
jgi:hypothetical protein